jgi:hypothetical protein
MYLLAMWNTFNTPPHVWQLWPNTCLTSGGKCPSLSKEPALILCKSPWTLLSKDALREEGCLWLIKCTGHVSLGDVGHFNTLPHVWQLFGQTRVQHQERKVHHHSRNLALIQCKSPWAVLTSKRPLERGGVSMAYKVSRSCIFWWCKTF